MKRRMGTFAVGCLIKNHVDRNKSVRVPKMLVDTGSEATWVPRSLLEQAAVQPEKRRSFQMANGQAIYRDVGYAIVRVGNSETTDEVVFSEPGDFVLLGARTLEGLALWVDPHGKKLVPTGPGPVAKVITPGKVPPDKDRFPEVTGVIQGEGGPVPVAPPFKRTRLKK
ncbi:MAG: retroviral-like aspartic protease family protein [Verrucomicrobiales bacterium]|nr:retroviral-like aspartic protease family protein [Verrucomicrobiales bacterium]